MDIKQQIKMKRIEITGRCFAGVKMAHPDEFSISSTGRNNYDFFPPMQYLVSIKGTILIASGSSQ